MREPARLSESELFWRKRKCARSESLLRQAKGEPQQRRNPMPRPNEETMTQSVQAVRREALTEVTWESINEPGAYVEKGSGDLYRIPKEALIPGASPAIVKESRGASVLVKLSDDPFVTTFKARLLDPQSKRLDYSHVAISYAVIGLHKEMGHVVVECTLS